MCVWVFPFHSSVCNFALVSTSTFSIVFVFLFSSPTSHSLRKVSYGIGYSIILFVIISLLGFFYRLGHDFSLRSKTFLLLSTFRAFCSDFFFWSYSYRSITLPLLPALYMRLCGLVSLRLTLYLFHFMLSRLPFGIPFWFWTVSTSQKAI